MHVKLKSETMIKQIVDKYTLVYRRKSIFVIGYNKCI